MPVHVTDWPNLEAIIREAEKKGERITQVVDAPNRVVVVTVAPFEIKYETRVDKYELGESGPELVVPPRKPRTKKADPA